MNEIKEYDKGKIEIPKYNNLNLRYKEAIQVVDDIVLKNYITKLNDFDIVPLSKEEITTNISENVRFFKITEMVYEKSENSLYKFASVFNTLATINCSIFIIVDSDGEKTDFYMGIRSIDSKRTITSLKNILKNAMYGQFPGVKTRDYFEDEMVEVLNKIRDNSISIVSTVANNKGDSKNNKSFIQGLEKFVIAMQGERYTAIIIAKGTSKEQLAEIRKNYEDIYTNLSPFANSQVSYSNNNSINLSKAFTEGISKGISYNKNESLTHGTANSNSMSNSNSLSKDCIESKLINGIGAAATILGAALSPVTGGISLSVGGVVGGSLSLLGNAIKDTETTSITKGNSFTENDSQTTGESFGKSQSKNKGTTDTKGLTKGNSQNISLTIKNKSAINILNRIDTQLERLKEFENLGMWECAAYFLSDSSYGAESAAATYKSLMRGENSGVEVSAINSWCKSDGNKIKIIKDYVKNFMHPIFLYNSPAGDIRVTPCSLVSGNELAFHMGLPRKSVSGLPVIEHVEFEKEVISYSNIKTTHAVNIGNIFNMGTIATNKVELDINSLAMHTFIAGSTGCGKSNTIYEILSQANNVGVNFLIVEPAKGEYKSVFGSKKNVTVLGTNPFYSQLFKINPFKFPNKIHILEHVDRLIEIFNVCWPMYAAMPSVLKEAILQSYENCGWDLLQSINNYSEELFPTFRDLQNELINVIQNSAYSQEVKSNYIGSLVTRVKSLTNGLNGQMFSSEEVDNNILFDSNVIIDLSRVGSLETKSFIMGILIMRLNEHRMSFTEGMNIPLRHVTVLEEAHNILKKTSGIQNPEGSNIAGKSVEMISNAIAEMRTYGEGFIIADQSPSSVDISAIKNTNTKIIMRLPDESDRKLVGKAAALKDEQLDEIAKLPKGVAVVYQNEWVAPVLCAIKKYDDIIINKVVKKQNTDLSKMILDNKILKSKFTDIILNNKLNKLQDLREDILNYNMLSTIKILLLDHLNSNKNFSSEEKINAIYDLYFTEKIKKVFKDTEMSLSIYDKINEDIYKNFYSNWIEALDINYDISSYDLIGIINILLYKIKSGNIMETDQCERFLNNIYDRGDINGFY